MIRLAARFGMSNVALRKRCHKHDIPTPGPGYWAQGAIGHRAQRRDLPPSDAGNDIFFRIVHDTAHHVPTVLVPQLLENAHSAVGWLEGALNEGLADRHGRRVVGAIWRPTAVLSERCQARALLLLDALFKALETRGHKVEARKRSKDATCKELLVSAFEQVVCIELEEKLARRPRVLTLGERRAKEKGNRNGAGSWNRAPKYDYYPGAELKLRMGPLHCHTGRKSWSDSPVQRLENLLGHAVVAIETISQLARNEKLEAEREARGVARQDSYRHELVEHLEELASKWRKANELRDFLVAYDRVLPIDQRDSVSEAWFNAAKSFAESIDPLTLPSAVAQRLVESKPAPA
jgi:hypothetical protein